jgi:hypothetical protein
VTARHLHAGEVSAKTAAPLLWYDRMLVANDDSATNRELADKEEIEIEVMGKKEV